MIMLLLLLCSLLPAGAARDVDRDGVERVTFLGLMFVLILMKKRMTNTVIIMNYQRCVEK